MKKIENLTAEQERAIKPFADSWINRLDKGAPVDKAEAIRLIKKLYSFSKLKEPEVLIVNSPLGAQLAAMLLKNNTAINNVRQNVRENVRQNVRRSRRSGNHKNYNRFLTGRKSGKSAQNNQRKLE